MNAGGGASSSSSLAAASGGAAEPQLRPYCHWVHLLLTILTAGLWLSDVFVEAKRYSVFGSHPVAS